LSNREKELFALIENEATTLADIDDKKKELDKRE